ncbi:MAG: hypothetical protein HY810_05595 [Candidatus Omnitrophica bacterium]|nr:hypothetical protein [Candidatus Omnitrophota bacterium]
MYILGISCFYHDSAAALIKDGRLICAAEEERFSRKKHDFNFPQKALDFCLEFAQIKTEDLSFVVFHEKPFRKFERILKTIIQAYPRSSSVFAEAMKNWLMEKLWIKDIIKEHLNISSEKILFVDHHLAHAASAFLLSPFEESAILTIDGVGEWATAALGTAKGNSICLLKQIEFPHSLGLLYSAFTAFLGFEVNEGEYKVMGMAPYGKPVFYDKIITNLINIHEDGSFELNMDYFAFHYSTQKSYSKKFEQLFGKPRPLESRFFTADTEFPVYFGEKPSDYEQGCLENQHYANIAASIQKVLEDIILKQATCLYKLTGHKKLCIAGGVALNSTANARLLQEGPFEELFIQPAPGDSGAAIGAAAYVYNSVLGNKRTFIMEDSYLGKAYSNEQIRIFLENKKVKFQYIPKDDTLIRATIDAIIDGKIAGWFQGRFEWGPRALGNRSILADPRNPGIKDIINSKIKFREPFRPFAPVILEEELENFFEIKNLYHGLVKYFGKKTGVPILLNTSFNLKGEPIVNSPENAYNTFIESGLDMLVLGSFIIEKENHEKTN